jgi:nucleoside-diphosphate-sugar epimerase
MADKLVIGCGYLGRVIAARWRAAGHRVFATTRSPQRAEEIRALGLDPVLCDVLQPATLDALPKTVDAVVHCVGFDRAAGVERRRVYVDGLANVLIALEGSAGRFLHVSSTGVYGQSDGAEVDENAATAPQEESGRVMLEAERLLLDRMPGIVLRFAGIYGPGRLLRARELRAGEPLAADPDNWLNVIHVEDGATAVVDAAERGRKGAIYNICDDNPVRRRDFYTRLAEVLGAPPPRFIAPPASEHVNRRIVNRHMKEELGVVLRYPGYREGLPAST